MNNITIGQFIPGDSFLHRLDPRVKLLSLVIMLVAIFMIPISVNPTPMILMGSMTVFIMFLTLLSGVSIRKVLNGLRPIVFLLTFTFFIQLFYVTQGNLVVDPIPMSLSISSIFAIILFIFFYHWSKKYISFRILYFFFAVVAVFAIQAITPHVISLYSYELQIYDQGLIRAGFIFVRIANVIVLSSLLTFTTMTTDLNYGIESLLKPLKIIKVPVDVLAMMLSLTLRYIPTLLGETEKIMKAQASRGVDFKESKTKDKILQIISLLIPVFVISFKRAEDLGNAMEVRGYVIGAKRTKIDLYNLGFKDVFSISVIVGILIMVIMFKGV
jgi:energy-coupling factor transport system permease protein